MLAILIALLIIAVLLPSWLYARHRRRVAYQQEQRATELFVATVEQSVSRSMGKGMPPRVRPPADARPVVEQPDALVWQDLEPEAPLGDVDPSMPPEVVAGLAAAQIELVPQEQAGDATLSPAKNPAAPSDIKDEVEAWTADEWTADDRVAEVVDAAVSASGVDVVAEAEAPADITAADAPPEIEMIEFESAASTPSNADTAQASAATSIAPSLAEIDTAPAPSDDGLLALVPLEPQDASTSVAIADEAATSTPENDIAAATNDDAEPTSQIAPAIAHDLHAEPSDDIGQVQLDQLSQMVEDASAQADAASTADTGIDMPPMPAEGEAPAIEHAQTEANATADQDNPALPAVLAVIASGAAGAAGDAHPLQPSPQGQAASVANDDASGISDRPARYNEAMREGELLHRRLAAIGRDHPERARLLDEAQAAHARAVALNERSAKAWARLGRDRLQLADMAGDPATELQWLRQSVDAFGRAAAIDAIPANDTLQRIRMQAWHRIGMTDTDERRVREALQQAVTLAEAHARMEPRNADAALRLHGMLCDLAGHCQGREHDEVIARALEVLDDTARHHPDMAQDLDLQRLLTRFVGLAGSHGAQQIFKLAELDRLFAEQAESQQRNPVFLVGWSRVLAFWAQRVSGDGAVQLFDRADVLLQQADALRPAHAPVLRQWAHTLHLRSRSQRDAPKLASLGAALQKLEAIPAEERNRTDLRNLLRTRLAWAQESRSPQADATLAEFAGELAPALLENDSMLARELRAEASLILARRVDDAGEKRAMLRRAMRDLRALESGGDTPWWAEAMLARLHAERVLLEGEAGVGEDIGAMSHHYERAVSLNPEPALLREWQETLRSWQERGLGSEHRVALEAAAQCYDRAVRRSRPGATRRMA